MSQVFVGRMLSHKWTKKERDVAVGDVVLLAEAENDDPTYRIGVVDSIKPGEDGHVRTVSTKYTNPGKTPEERSPPKFTTRPIHKVAVIVPVGYVFEDDHGTESGRAELPALAGASVPEEAALAQPDSADEGSARLDPDKVANAAEAQQAPGGSSVGATGEPGPITAEKRGPGRPKRGIRADADPSVAPVAILIWVNVLIEKPPFVRRRTCAEEGTRAPRRGHYYKQERIGGGSSRGIE
jgi:hypothetical protein